MLLGSLTIPTDLLALSVSSDGRGFFCQTARFLAVPGRRNLEERELCVAQGM